MSDELKNEVLRRSVGELSVEGDDEQVRDSKIADQRDFMLCRGKQTWRFLGSEHLRRMWIESDHDRRSFCLFGVSRRSGNHGLVAKMQRPALDKQLAVPKTK